MSLLCVVRVFVSLKAVFGNMGNVKGNDKGIGYTQTFPNPSRHDFRAVMLLVVLELVT